MRCPFCSSAESKVVDSRAADDSRAIRRRRECLNCARRFTTYEIFEDLPLMVVKKDGRREIFDRTKLLNGLLKAFEKRPVPLKTIEALVDKVEMEIRNTLEREISSQKIGEMIMQYLKNIDQVAYVRFASVYRQFTDLNNFMQELEMLMKLQQRS